MQKLTASDAEEVNFFGESVSLSGNTAVVGTSRGLRNAGGGGAYAFQLAADEWIERGKLDAPDADAYSRFGQAVAVDGDRILVGAPYDDHDDLARAGSIVAFDLTAADFFAVDLRQGDRVVVSTSTPTGGTRESVNSLDPTLALIGPGGALVAVDDHGMPDGRNALIEHTAETTGRYMLQVARGTEALGEYVVAVAGHAGEPPRFEVAATEPRDGSRLQTPLEQVTVHLGDAVLLDTLDPSALTVDGAAASDVLVVDGDTLTFVLPPDVGEGTHQVAIARAALRDLQGTSIEPWIATISVDTKPPKVIASSLLEAAMTAPGTLTWQVQFGEELDAASVDASWVQLMGQYGHEHRPVRFDFDVGSSTLTLEFADLPEDVYRLTLLSGEGRFQDLSGNELDGEPDPYWTVPSGDGVPGGDFVVNFIVDIDRLAADPLLERRDPPGSLIWAGSTSAVVVDPADTDGYTIGLHAGQTLTVGVVPQWTLQATIQLLDPRGNPIGAAAAEAPGANAELQTVTTSEAGTYTVTVGGTSGSTGGYTVHLVLNAALQHGWRAEPGNLGPASAQDLDASFIALDGSSAQRAGALGTRVFAPGTVLQYEGFEAGVLGDRWETYSSLPDGRIQVAGEHGTAAGQYALLMDHNAYTPNENLNEAIWRVDLSAQTEATLSFLQAEWGDERDIFHGDFTGHYGADGVAISADGVRWHPVADPPYHQPVGSWVPRVVDLAAEASLAGIPLGPDFRVKFQQTDNLSLSSGNRPAYSKDGRGYDEIQISVPHTWEGDWYRFSLSDGEAASLALTALSGASLRLDLLDDGQRLLATSAAAPNQDQRIHHFVDSTTDGDRDEYYVRVSGIGGDYTLLLTRNAALDDEPNNDLAAAGELSPAGAAVGYLRYPLPATLDADPAASPAPSSAPLAEEAGSHPPGGDGFRIHDHDEDRLRRQSGGQQQQLGK